MSFKIREKKDRNERLYQFWLSHQDWTYRAIAAIFHISYVRAWEIIKRERKWRDGDNPQPSPDNL